MGIFVNATVFSIIYILFHIFEMRVITKEAKPMKQLLRDALIVYLAVVSGDFILEQIAPLTNVEMGQPTVFVNEPDF